MKGFVKKIDEMGRVVIPKDIRNVLGVKNLDSIEFSLEDGYVTIRKFEEACTLCSSIEDIRYVKGKPVCLKCIEEMKNNY